MKWLGSPVPGGIITARFGDSGPHWTNDHTGTDFAGLTGTPTRAVADGRVTFADWNGNAYGNTVKIDHGGGLETWYAHLSATRANVGDMVSKGDTIGLLGATGNVTGPHVHLEVRENGTPVAPEKYLGSEVEGGTITGGAAAGGNISEAGLTNWAWRAGLFIGGVLTIVLALYGARKGGML